MIGIPYNPFNRPFEDLEPIDLAVLREVAEGWYTEYKSMKPTTKKIAKSLAAFANHYGGWVFYGVKQTDDGTNKAESFPGLDEQEVSLLVEGARNAAKDAISPSPYYDHRILKGPCNEIGLPHGRAIVVIAVPAGPNTPYIHCDGKIYRRVADSSDPKPETDRFTLDQLWQRGQRARDRVTTFLEREPILSEGESEASFIDLFLLPDPLGASGQRSKLTFDEFVKLMTDQDTPDIRFTCDNLYTMPDGFVGRQIGANDPYRLHLAWQHFSSGFSIVTLPLSSAVIDVLGADGWLRGYKHEEVILGMIKAGHHTDSYMVDVNQLILFVLCVFGRQRQLMEAGNIRGPFYAKAALHNMWRRIPFLDTAAFIRFVDMHGFPVIQFNDEFAPPGKTYDSLRLIPDEETPGVGSQQIRDALHLTADIFRALGLPAGMVVGVDDKEDHWLSATKRAQDVNLRRSETPPDWS